MALLCLFPAPLSRATEIDPDAVVDHHVHFFSPEVVAVIERSGFGFSVSDYQYAEGPAFYDLDVLVHNNGAAKMLLLSGGFNYDFEDEAARRQAVVRENDRLAAAVRERPDRLYGFCGLDPLAEWAEDEARRCAEELNLQGIKLHLPISGVDLGRADHRSKTRRFLASCAQAGLPVLIHNATDALSGREYAQLFVDSFLDELDGLTLIFAHAGGGSTYGAFTLEFLDAFAEYLHDGESRHRHDVYFELSAFLAEGRVPADPPLDELRRMMEAIGYDRFLFGSDYPMRSARRYLDELRRRLELEPEILESISSRDVLGAATERP